MTTKTKNLILLYVTLFISAFIPALIWNKWAEAVIFIICHSFVRPQFKKQYHHIIPAVCRTISACVVFFGISFMLPLNLSFFSAIPICYFISWVGFIKKKNDELEIRCDELEIEIETILMEIKRYKHIDIFKMTEEELRQYGASNKLSETQLDILCLRVFKHLKISEICEYYNYGRTTIKYHLAQIKEKLGITTL